MESDLTHVTPWSASFSWVAPLLGGIGFLVVARFDPSQDVLKALFISFVVTLLIGAAFTVASIVQWWKSRKTIYILHIVLGFILAFVPLGVLAFVANKLAGIGP